MDNKTRLLEFLKSQKFLVIATQGDGPWIVNVFPGVDNNFNIYFVSGVEAEHSKHIIKKPNVTFSTVWFNPSSHLDRKGVQGRGTCHISETEEETETGIHLHNTNFPEFKDSLTLDYIRSEDNKSRVWIIKPSFIKFWNDELYGQDGSEKFNF